jgi:trehalose 6-phosphate synthase
VEGSGGEPAAGRLIVISNRLPEVASRAKLEERRNASVGGLVSALRPALEAAPGSMWFGWSGRAVDRASGGRVRQHRSRIGPVTMIGFDLAEEDVDLHYNGFCNGALWPLLHCIPSRVSIDPADHDAYRRVNRRFARAIGRRLAPGDRVWVHDYHLIPLGAELRRAGFAGRIGFFLHVPFPPHDLLAILPAAGELLADMAAYDVVGFHTRRYVQNYREAVEIELGSPAEQAVGAYPIGIDPRPYAEWALEPAARERARDLREAVRGRRIILGVDRLDYTKGIAERLRIFARLLERYPRFRGEVSFIQISAPSRTRVAQYIQQRREIEELVGNINGRFGEAGWVPVRYLFRSYSQRELVAFYSEADVCLVSPLRDGMNLVAKEFIASQVADPGVLVLSRFAGAAEELREALIFNPYDTEGAAQALARALDMPAGERRRRQEALLARVRDHTAARWARAFLRDLARARPEPRRAGARPAAVTEALG